MPPTPQPPTSHVLFDVDGTLIDAAANQRRVWNAWAQRYGLDGAAVYEVALRTRPVDTFAAVAPELDAAEALALLHDLEDADVRDGAYTAFAGAAELLRGLPVGGWALVTSNYVHRVRGRFARTGLPMPAVVVDAAAADRGKPHPDPYLLAALLLRTTPARCLVIEDSPAGVRAGLDAGMTVWTVNTDEPVPGAHRYFPTLRDAIPHVTTFATR
ncbi:HAD-IA family hydrolase [Streptomyces sp. SID3343]|uniref:HAD family hydrolase n=1 Tax=Streptomyces sp. SID3343 TaxID=2690260 RepID=UPI001369F91E|nr:HAD-IA family hydrolase [Streptomyces sp. SID3343]MYW03828.1 HAD-IA family hydrolase [Streptomyces sp. SID3343]